MRASNSLTGLLNVLILVLSIPILAGGIWLNHKANTTDCEHFLAKPIVVLGVFLLLVSIAGIVGACCRVNWLLWLYLFVMFLLILLLFCFTIFAFVVTNKGAGNYLAGKGYKEYRLGDYSDWLQKRVSNAHNWNRIKSCLIAGKACQTLIDQNTTTTLSDFSAQNLSPIQSGCCKPSDECGFTYVSPTNWTNLSTTTESSADCNLWSNDDSILCYNCGSCKAGVLQNIKTHWKKIAIVNIVFLVILIVVYSVGCYAFRNNREDNYNNQWNWKPYR